MPDRGAGGGHGQRRINVNLLDRDSYGNVINVSSAEVQSVLIHEMTHAFTALMNWDLSVLVASGFKNNVLEGFQEAAAITVEEQFRRDMGFPSRAEARRAMGLSHAQIGINDYGFWPWMANHPASNLYGQVNWRGDGWGISMMQGPFIVQHIISGGWR